MKIQSMALKDLKLDPKNANTHPDVNLESIKRSLTKFGQQKPIVIDKKNIVVAGNGTVMAAKELGWETINVIVTTLKANEKKAYAIADNRTTELSEWDTAVLGKQLRELDDAGWELDDIGFGDWEFEDNNEESDSLPSGKEKKEEWKLDTHRLISGDEDHKPSFLKIIKLWENHTGKKAERIK